MGDWLDPVRAGLDGRITPTMIFMRDDDAGWADEQLYQLLEIVQDRELPLDVAAIPAAVTPALARALSDAIDGMDGRVAVHQHGFSHVNHESTGRKSEFGPSRAEAQQRADIVAGRRKLEDAFGARLADIFTPPWNRCTETTANVLVELGFDLLSRDASAPAFGISGLGELPVDLDWSGRRGASVGPIAWGQSIGRAIASAAQPVGLMLHHAVMTDEDRRLLRELLAVVARHPMARVLSMLQCFVEDCLARSSGSV
jgi:predicted deacetylase